MPIRFACPQCGNQLMAAAQCVAKETRCRKCGTMVPIPAVEQAVSSSCRPIGTIDARNAEHGEGDQNPYRSPNIGGSAASSGEGLTRRDGTVLTDIVPETVDVGDVFRIAWHVAWEHFDCILTMSVPALIALALTNGGSVAIDYSLGIWLPLSQESEPSYPGDGGQAWRIGMFGVGILAKCAFVWLFLGLVRYGQRVVRLRPESWSCIFWGRRPFFRGCVLLVLYTLLDVLVLLPIAFVQVPALLAVLLLIATVLAVLIALSLSQSVQLIVDEDLSVLDAIRVSRKIMATNKGALFAVLAAGWIGPSLLLAIPIIAGLLLSIVPLVRLLLLLAIGGYVLWMMVALPFILTLLCVFYFQATGRSV